MSAPIINSIAPGVGPVHGGTEVSIAGSGFSSTTAVLFGDATITFFDSIDDSLIRLTAPKAAAPGLVDIAVNTPNGNAIWFEAFDYLVSIDSIFPVSGPVGGGTSLKITGSGLLQIASILFNDTPAPAFKVSDDAQMNVTTPPGTAPGSVDLSFLAADGNPVFIEFGAFSYTAPPAPTPPPAAPAQGAQAPASPTPAAADPAAPAGGGGGGKPPAAPKPAAPDPAAADPNAAKPAAPDPAPAKPPASPPAAPDTGASPKPAAPAPGGPAAAGGSSTPTPSGDYIPGGRMIVPDGKTGLGGTAGTGAGFGVGTLMAGGGGSTPPSNLPYYVDPALTSQIVQSLLTLVQNATSPDALEAQNIILRRIALEGDVIGSRIPPPRNISEIGGYLNLLATLKENTMRQQTLAGILGVAGPTQPLGWITNNLPLSMVPITNDRPAVAAQASFPLTILVRSDFVVGVQNALKTLHSYGATLPLTSPPVIQLPPGGPGATVPNPILYYLGRTLNIAPSAALLNPAADPVVLIPPTPPFPDYFLASHVLNSASIAVPPTDVSAVQCTPTTRVTIPLSQFSFVPLASILAAAGFYSPSPFPLPPNSTSRTWASLTNTTGLVAGETMLGQELSLLYRQDLIANSALAAMIGWIWNGTAFAP